jgi:cellobiose-specific phosphotransferase system component IIB
VCCVGRGLCDELITRAEESCLVCVCLIVCDVGTSTVSLLVRELGSWATEKSVLNCVNMLFWYQKLYQLDILQANCKRCEESDCSLLNPCTEFTWKNLRNKKDLNQYRRLRG